MDVFLFIWYTIFPLLGFVGLITLPWLIPLIWFRIIPKAARTLFWAARRKMVPAYIVHDSGRGAMTLIQERRGEGVVITDHGKYRLLPRYVEATEKDNPKNQLDYSAEWITKRSIMASLGLPFYIGYSGSLCLLNPEALAWYEAGKIFVPTANNPVPNEKQKDLPKPLMLLDLKSIKSIINRAFDTTQISAVLQDMYLLGLLGRGFNKTLISIGAIILVVVAVLAILFFLPQMGLA